MSDEVWFPIGLQVPRFKEWGNIKVINLCEKEGKEKKSKQSLNLRCCVLGRLSLDRVRVRRIDAGSCSY